MGDYSQHLIELTTSVTGLPPAANTTQDALKDWTRYQSHLHDTGPSQDIDVLTEDEPWPSVLDAFEAFPTSQNDSSSADDPLIHRLVSQGKFSAQIQKLTHLLASGRPDDAISEEMVDMFGFDEIELVMSILSRREDIAMKLDVFALEAVDGAANTREAKTNTHHEGDKSMSDMSYQAVRRRMEETLRANTERPLWTGTAEQAHEVLPYVFTSSSAQGNMLSYTGSKFMLPIGTTRETNDECEEVIIPPSKPVPPRATERPIRIDELDALGEGSFPGYTSLNRIQSVVYPTAYSTNENMLVCAPTGAGKTDVAMLTVLRVIDQHRSHEQSGLQLKATIRRDDFKIIYVAPMKALAAEIVRKLGKRLAWLSIRVRELTGDMQLTKAEIAETQLIVTTPEKWDVVTRKPTGEGQLATQVKLLIIDEVHLLNEERGAVIETIVARTLRQVESTQSLIRIVGLSATLPNYVDVADFLRVNRYKGLFFFDSSFRPVPLEQHFLGIKGKANSQQARKNLDKVTYDKVAELVQEGHQVMVFVHARKETVKSALSLKEAATTAGTLDNFSCESNSQYQLFRREIATSRNKEMRQLFDSGFGIHHAGMLRSDRNMMEKMFEARAIKVLCTTATLAWGVNLPAHAVIIKGTQVYDSTKGSFVNLSVLDVLQIFGRAGRPGLETSGVGYICTPEDTLPHYLDAVTTQHPIESKFTMGIVDSLNAEIALGTVATVPEAIEWIGYTYFFVRMRRNPFFYGISRDALIEDPQLGARRNEIVKATARSLFNTRMVDYNDNTGSLQITDLGRIAAKYYIRHSSIEIFNKEMKPKMTAADVLDMLSKSTEFVQMQVRESEAEELKSFLEAIPCEVKGMDTTPGKVNILLQAHISQLRPEDFALVSDMAYVAQNAGRIMRGLLEIAVSRKWATVSSVLVSLSKAVEKRMWPFDHPLKQFSLNSEVLYMITRWADDWPITDLASLTGAELGQLVHLNEHHGEAIQKAARQFPRADLSCNLRPLGPDILKLVIHVARSFSWNSRLHGLSEPFWLWVEDHQASEILQMSAIAFRENTRSIDVEFFISIPEGRPPPSVTIRLVSERWLGAEEDFLVTLADLVMPQSSNSHSPRLDLPFLSTSVLRNTALSDLWSSRLTTLNALQTQCFWSLMNTRQNALLAAPTGCGKSVMAQMVALNTVLLNPKGWSLIVAPRRSMAWTMVSDLRTFSPALSIGVQLIDEMQLLTPGSKTIKVTTPGPLLRYMSQNPAKGSLSNLSLVLCENLEQLDAEYELCITLLLQVTQSQSTRFVGLSSSLNDAADVAAWLRVDPYALHSFRPSDSDQSLAVKTQTFTIPHSAALFKAMAKPVHAAIRNTPMNEGVIIFVPSKTHCRTAGADLVTQTALESELNMRGYLPDDVALAQLEPYLDQLRDRSLSDLITRGIGIYHEGIPKLDRAMILELFVEGIVRVLLVPRETCWTVPVRAATVVVMGTQYLYYEPARGDRQLRDYTLPELVHMQGRAVRHLQSGSFYLLCQAESRDTLTRFLNDGLPLESSLHESNAVERWFADRLKAGAISGPQQCVDLLSHSYLAKRLASNSIYYNGQLSSSEGAVSRMADLLLLTSA